MLSIRNAISIQVLLISAILPISADARFNVDKYCYDLHVGDKFAKQESAKSWLSASQMGNFKPDCNLKIQRIPQDPAWLQKVYKGCAGETRIEEIRLEAQKGQDALETFRDMCGHDPDLGNNYQGSEYNESDYTIEDNTSGSTSNSTSTDSAGTTTGTAPANNWE
jgi:hypothetical protein